MAFVMNFITTITLDLFSLSALLRFCACEVNNVYGFLIELWTADKPVLWVVSFARTALFISYPSPLFEN